MRIRNVTRGTELARQARAARSSWSRLIGLLGRSSLREGEGLLLEPCNAVHMFFMRFAIDVVYIDKQRRVVKLVERLRPFRVSAAFRSAHAALELPVGAIAASGTQGGDQLAFEE